MALATPPPPSSVLTYEQYLTEGEINRRYDILGGVRRFIPIPTREHQRFALRVARLLDDYARAFGRAQAIIAPCDVLITRNPLRTRQPDVLLISNEQLAKCPPATDPAALVAAPELVVEILSPTETRRVRADKLTDYCSIGVRECWMVSREAETVEVLRLTTAGAETAAIHGSSGIVRSLAFPDLEIAVADVFAV